MSLSNDTTLCCFSSSCPTYTRSIRTPRGEPGHSWILSEIAVPDPSGSSHDYNLARDCQDLHDSYVHKSSDLSGGSLRCTRRIGPRCKKIATKNGSERTTVSTTFLLVELQSEDRKSILLARVQSRGDMNSGSSPKALAAVSCLWLGDLGRNRLGGEVIIPQAAGVINLSCCRNTPLLSLGK